MVRRVCAVALLAAACGGEPAGEGSAGSGSTASTIADTTTVDPATTSSSATSPADTSDTGSSTVVDTSTGDAPPACPLPDAVDAVIDPRWGLQPIVRVADPDVGAVTAIATPTILVRTLDGAEIWSADHGEGTFFGGYDYDDDGWPDLGLAHHEDGATPCGASTVGTSWLTLIDGRDGSVVTETAPEADICWMFPSATYPTIQWGAQPLFGDGPALFLAPYYATIASLSQWDGASFGPADLYYPSTSSYDSTYTADLPNAWGTGTSYLASSHVANGLVGTFAGETRVVFFTSGRVVQYAETAAPADRLRADRPFLSGGRTDLAGRNYGLVARDPGAPDRVVLLAGTSITTLFLDTVAGTMSSDPWGGIERHVAIYDTVANTVVDRFFSYAHDNGDGNQFEGRVAHPDNPFVRMPSGASRLAYSVYEGGHWVLHVSLPGDPADAVTVRGLALFDIRDLDGDGADEWIASRTELPGDDDVPGWYYARWRLDVYRWDEATLSLQEVTSDDRGLPHPLNAFRGRDRSSSSGALHPIAVVDASCVPAIVLRTPTGELVTATLPGATPPDDCTCG